MKTNNKINKIKLFILTGVSAGILTMGVTSCSDVLEADAADVLTFDQVYRNVDDADAAVRGVYGMMMDVATQYVVLNELRADLMDVTDNADPELVALSKHADYAGERSWTNPKKFFSLINNCNDVIKNFNIMYNTNKLSREDYNCRYSDVVAIRCWAYLQVSLHFADSEKGGVPYITEPMGDIASVSSLAKYPYLSLPVMIDSLLKTMEALPYKVQYTDGNLLLSVNGYSPAITYIDKEYLLGELNLWKGNYYKSAYYFKTIMERGGNSEYDKFRIPYDATATLQEASSKYNSGYERYYGNDRLRSRNNWPCMFTETSIWANFNSEWLWLMYFDELTEPNTFNELFAKTGGSYLLKPSVAVMKRWNEGVQKNGFKGDFRGYYPGVLYNSIYPSGSYDMEGNDPIITKFISDLYYGGSTLSQSGRWFLWRAGSLHLRYCEAANRDGQNKIAYSLLNNGIGANFQSIYPNASSNNYTDSTLRNQTGLAFPYDFDARMTQLSDLPPNLRKPWFRNTGIRSRVSMPNTTVEGDSTLIIEEQLLNESGLELAFEGQRWADLVRISLRRGDNSILADKVAAKSGEIDGAIQAKLMDQKNWFLPLKW